MKFSFRALLYSGFCVQGCLGGNASTLKIICRNSHALPSQQLHFSRKNHVTNVTSTGMDVIVHDERLLG